MAKVTIDASDQCFILRGAVDYIERDIRAKSNFISIGAIFHTKGKITVPFDETTKEKHFESIKLLLVKFDLDQENTPETEALVEDIASENAAFSEFSGKAQNIRNDIHEGDDFKKFADVVCDLVKRKLYKLQLLSAYHLAFAQNACNFSVPGAGKTSTVYAAYAYLKNHPTSNPKHVNRLLIICPLSAFGPWKDEYRECFGTPPKVKELVRLSSEQRKRHFAAPGDTEITLISYQSASSDIRDIENYLKCHQDVMLVLDEAHKIKNTSDSAVWAKAILSVAKYAKSRVVLTGTPAPNRYEDLYNLFEFIWPERNIIGFPLGYFPKIESNPEHKSQLIGNLSPFFIRVKKGDLSLPEPVYNEPIMVPMAADQRAIYKHIEKNCIASFETTDDDGLSAQLQKAKTIRLRQCLTNPALLKNLLSGFKEISVIGVNDREILAAIDSYQSIPNKFIEVAKLIKEIIKADGPSGKVIVWAYFIGNIESLSKYLEDQGIANKLLYGATPNENEDTEEDMETREKIIRDFHDYNCPYRVILANPFAVGESISLHKACHNAIYLEKDFNATNYMQSKDRTHRYGLEDDDKVNYYFLLSEDSIDKSIHNRVLEKEKKMLEIIESEEIPLLQNMLDDEVDENDIKAIIKDYHVRKSATAV